MGTGRPGRLHNPEAKPLYSLPRPLRPLSRLPLNHNSGGYNASPQPWGGYNRGNCATAVPRRHSSHLPPAG